jgi:hypothetical protein
VIFEKDAQMRTTIALTVVKAYLALVLLIGVLFSPLPYSLAAMIFFAVQLYSSFRHLGAQLTLVFMFGTLVILPVILESVAGLFSVLSLVPALCLLDSSLKENSSEKPVKYVKEGRSASMILKGLGSSLFLLFSLAVVLGSLILLITSLALSGYIVVVLFLVFRGVRGFVFVGSKKWCRVVVGDSGSSLFRIRARENVPLRVSVGAFEGWVRANPSEFFLGSGEIAEVKLDFSPPLAGPSNLRVSACGIDPWGLVLYGEILEVLDLYIIPRAKYAKWLANRFLEQTVGGESVSGTSSLLMSSRASRHGNEYYGNRPYEAGDRLRDVDWKHSFRNDELVVKEFIGSKGPPVVLVADLTAKDAEDADVIAYNLVMSALTAAAESLPSGLVVYNSEGFRSSTFVGNPRNTLKKALELTGQIVIVEAGEKFLHPVDIGGLRRSMTQLSKNGADSTERLKSFLEFEIKATGESARNDLGAEALLRTLEKTPPPASIIVTSKNTSDSCGMVLVLEELKKKGYFPIQIDPNS